MMYPVLPSIGASKQSGRFSFESTLIIGSMENNRVSHRRRYPFSTILPTIMEDETYEPLALLENKKEQRDFVRPQLFQQSSADDWSEMSCIIHDDDAESEMRQQYLRSSALAEEEFLELITMAFDGLHAADC